MEYKIFHNIYFTKYSFEQDEQTNIDVSKGIYMCNFRFEIDDLTNIDLTKGIYMCSYSFEQDDLTKGIQTVQHNLSRLSILPILFAILSSAF